jgi:hypothetical protein
MNQIIITDCRECRNFNQFNFETTCKGKGNKKLVRKDYVINFLIPDWCPRLKGKENKCPHFFQGTDGVHCVIINRCGHTDGNKWVGKNDKQNT